MYIYIYPYIFYKFTNTRTHRDILYIQYLYTHIWTSYLTFFLAYTVIFYLTSFLAFYLAPIMRFYIAFYLASILTFLLTFCLAFFLALSLTANFHASHVKASMLEKSGAQDRDLGSIAHVCMVACRGTVQAAGPGLEEVVALLAVIHLVEVLRALRGLPPALKKMFRAKGLF